VIGPGGEQKPLRLTEDGERARFPSIAATGSTFAVVWLDLRSSEIHARVLGEPVVATVAHVTVDARDQPFLSVTVDGEELRFAWQDRDALRERRLPAALSGFELFREIGAFMEGMTGAFVADNQPQHGRQGWTTIPARTRQGGISRARED
jgi:YD repeat-containing protein